MCLILVIIVKQMCRNKTGLQESHTCLSDIITYNFLSPHILKMTLLELASVAKILRTKIMVILQTYIRGCVSYKERSVLTE